MTLSYQLTLDDYREAQLGVKPERTWRRRLLGSVGGWVLFIGLALMLWLLLRADSPRGVALEPAEQAAPFAMRLGAALASTLVFGAVLTFFMARQLFQPLPKPWIAPPPSAGAKTKEGKAAFGRGIFGWVLFIALAVMLFTFLNSRQRPAPAAGTPAPVAAEQPARLTAGDFAIGLAPWIVGMVILVAVNRLAADRNLRRMWDAQPFMHRPESLEVTAERVRFSEARSTREYEWSYFAGYKETPNLFLLYVSPLAFYIVPKRAFASEAETDAFRGMLLNGVEEGQFLDRPSSFPVLQPGAAAAAAGPPPLPRPALPLESANRPEH